MRSKLNPKMTTAHLEIKRIPQKRKLNTVLLSDGIDPKKSTGEKTLDKTSPCTEDANGNSEKFDLKKCNFLPLDVRPFVGTKERRLEIRSDPKTKKITLLSPAIAPKLKVDFNELGIESTRRVAGVEVQNVDAEKKQKLAKLIVRSASNHEVWSTMLDSHVSSLSANQNWTVAALPNGQLHVYATNSGVLRLSLRLPSPALFLCVTDQMCAVVDEKADISTWDLQRMQLVGSHQLTLLLDETNAKISGCCVTNSGIPIVLVDNGDVWFHSTQKGVWKRLRTCVDACSRLTRYFQVIRRIVPNGLIAQIVLDKKKIKEATAPSTAFAEITEEEQLEKLMQTLIELRSPAEFHLLSSIYVNLIVTRGKVYKLKSFIEMLNHLDPNTGVDPNILREEIAHLFVEHPNVARDFETLAAGRDVLMDRDDDFGFI